MKTIQDLIQHITDECKAVDREERFDALLDDCYDFSKVGGPFEHMSPSTVLKECDPIAYRCGVNDYADGEGWLEIGGDYYESSDVEEARESFVDELESELSDLEAELEELNIEEDRQEPEIDRIQSEISALSAFIKECRNYSF